MAECATAKQQGNARKKKKKVGVYDPTQRRLYECRVWQKVIQNKQMEPECNPKTTEPEGGEAECRKTSNIELDISTENELENRKAKEKQTESEWVTKLTEFDGEGIGLKCG